MKKQKSVQTNLARFLRRVVVDSVGRFRAFSAYPSAVRRRQMAGTVLPNELVPTRLRNLRH